MQHLRIQVDRIDLKILQLLRQRTKLSRRIGETKRRHRAVIYVPERERELFRRVARLSRGKLSAPAVQAIFREILSSSRAEQGQAPIGLLKENAAAILPSARWCFGACDEFQPLKGWPELARGLSDGSLALGLLTGAELAAIVRGAPARKKFLEHLQVVGDFSSSLDPRQSLGQRIFIVTARRPEAGQGANRILILIECKSSGDALKSLLKSMPKRFLSVQPMALAAAADRRGISPVLMRMVLTETENVPKAMLALQSTGTPFSVLGSYHGMDNYAG